MTFKAAKCPDCGGALQVPDDRAMVKCMYCGVDVIVREAIQLAAGRVKEFTYTTPITRPKDRIGSKMLLTFGGIIALSGIELLFLMQIGLAIFLLGLALCFLIPSIMRLRRPKEIKQIGIKGLCPYCETPVSNYQIFGVKNVGTDCEACKRRIVIRDNKFFSVDTPISGLKKPEQ
jgi:hypothetical protein